MFTDDPQNEELLPFGFYGPLRYNEFTVAHGTNTGDNLGSNVFALGGKQILDTSSIPDATTLIITGSDRDWETKW